MKMLSVVKKSAVNGVQEITTGEMTDGERMIAGGGLCVGVVAPIGVVLVAGSALGVVTKVALLVSPALVVGAFGKAFVRGFREQYSQMKMANQ